MFMTFYPSTKTVEALYASTPEGSPVRRLIVDIFVAKGESDWLDDIDLEDKHHAGYLRDIAVRQKCMTAKERKAIDEQLDSSSPTSYHHE